ncbi:hypothetical protein [Streptomyces sp. NPDC096132]|uniref:hypothetical protein n=1 Tax=Streptomyces sp. NPDC096132 TaxID=3366075 RepID=UPI0038094A94
MTLIDRARRFLYFCAGAFTVYCATNSARAGAPWYAVAFLAVTALLITADLRDYLDANERHAAAVQAERASRLRAREDERRMREDADTLAARRAPLTPEQVLGASTDGPQCVCDAPIEWWTGLGEAGWIHSPGSDTRCLEAQLAYRTAPPAEAEQLLRWGRRESLLVLVTRIQRGRTLTDDEARTLREHVEMEMREAETARAVAAGNLKHVRILIPELEQAQAAIGRAEDLAARWDRALAPDKSYARALRRALDGSDQSTIQKDSA